MKTPILKYLLCQTRNWILAATIAVPVFAQRPPEERAPGTTPPAGVTGNPSAVPSAGAPAGIPASDPLTTSPSGRAPVAGDPFVKPGSSVAVPAKAAEESISNFQVWIETFDLSRTDFSLLLEAGDDAAMYARTVEWMADSKKAKLVNFAGCIVRSGMRTVIESIHEVRYPIEFELPPAEEEIIFPSTFETRNAGDTIEFELAMEADEKRGSLAIGMGSVRLAKFEDHLGAADRPTSAVAQPMFSTRKVSSNMNVVANQPRFLGTFSATGEDSTPSDTVRVAFVTVRPTPTAPIKTPPISESTSVRLEYTFFSLEKSAARTLMLSQADSQKCYDALRGMVASKTAQLDHTSVSVTSSGNRTVTEEIIEQKYAIEFNPPSFPGDQGGGNDSPEPDPKNRPGTQVNQRVSHVNPLPPGAFPKKAPIPPAGVTYETRNTGFTAETEPVLFEDGIRVEGQAVPQFVRNMGSLDIIGVGKAYPKQPLFETRKWSGNFSSIAGRQQFLSTYNAPRDSGANGIKDDGRVCLGFLRVVPLK